MHVKSILFVAVVAVLVLVVVVVVVVVVTWYVYLSICLTKKAIVCQPFSFTHLQFEIFHCPIFPEPLHSV